MAWYLDTSAFMKLVVAEHHATALKRWATKHPYLVSSDLLRTEALRAARRMNSEVVVATRAALDVVAIGAIPSEIYERAAELDPSILRTLDAVHLAWALAMGDELEGIVTYDDRLAAAARIYGVSVVAPGVRPRP